MSEDNPCVGICEIDESGYCIGCGRSADVIFGETDSAADSQADAEVASLAGLPGERPQAAD
ncbi:MAG: DUF1289 domain-containing protein [Zoogloea sp.]|jgi:predicted Fe-S protein YdhL (DUF1289 family)|nr:DUF1289 domain-containing protein [Zoogloea sp.]MCA0188723.1 DUF1289 domain-containing protein [Pseudomonadota bacterium]